MLNQLSEQMKKSAQPVSDVFAANVRALQEVAQQQASLMSGVLGDSIKLLDTVKEQTEIKGLVAAQSVYAESIRERLTSTSKTTYATLNHARQDLADAFKNALEPAELTAKPASKAVAVSKPAKAAAKTSAKKASTKKVATKKVATKSSAASAKQSDVKATETKATDKKTSKPASRAPRAKAAVAKKAAKPLPTLSADNVRATPKTSDAQSTIDTASEKATS